MPDPIHKTPAEQPDRPLLGPGSHFEGLLVLHGAARIDGTLRFLGRDIVTREDTKNVFNSVGDKYIETLFRRKNPSLIIYTL